MNVEVKYVITLEEHAARRHSTWKDEGKKEIICLVG